MLKEGQRVRVPDTHGSTVVEATFCGWADQSQAEWVEDPRCVAGGRLRDVGLVRYDDGSVDTWAKVHMRAAG
jgi:hypothetical protein